MIRNVLSVLSVLCVLPLHAEEASDAPVPFPELKHFAPLWERSIFTTKDLPAPEVVGGPSFIDNLSLSGMYEIQGEVVAMIVDKTTSMVYSTKIGSENEIGVKIRKITGEITDSKTRIQLQKGEQVGWLNQNDGMSAPSEETVRPAGIPGQAPQGAPGQIMPGQPRLGPGAPSGLPTRQAPTPGNANLLLPPASGTAAAVQMPATAPTATFVPPQIPQSPPPQITPAVTRPQPSVNANNDIPLPPP